jgi:hypothetical protein
MEQLCKAYNKIQATLGTETEPFESASLVETYRRFMKPEKVKIVPLAESHVYTSDSDRQISMPPIPALPGYPTQYARFVYCLGYGEKALTRHILHPSRDGTPQFWKIFYSCCNRITNSADFSPILRTTPVTQRLANKVWLLQQMKARGIWLVDVSIVALYKGGEKMPNMFNALKASWETYTRDVVAAAQPEQVICIGKGVANIVGRDLQRLFQGRYTVVHQPNAHLSSEEHMENLRTYSRMCC